MQAEANELERSLNDLKAELDSKRLPLIRIRDATKSLNERITIKSERLEKTEKDADKTKKEIEETRKKLNDFEEKYQQFIKEFESEETTDNLAHLPIQQKEEYHKTKKREGVELFEMRKYLNNKIKENDNYLRQKDSLEAKKSSLKSS